MIPLSVLDLSVVTTETRPAASLRNSIDLAHHVDELGYIRYWLAEHHNLSSVASPAPDVMIGQIAAVTRNIPPHWGWPSGSRCSRRYSPAASILASAVRPAPTARPPTRCAAGSTGARAT